LALPHEHIHPQHYFDVDSLTKEKEWEIYGLYSYLVDLHISQIRPNVSTKNYINKNLNRWTIDDPYRMNYRIDNKFIDYFCRYRGEEAKFVPSNFKKWEEAKAAAPKNDHPDARGTEFDVEWTNDQKHPHVATRTGFPEF